MNTIHKRSIAALVTALFIGGNANHAIAQAQTAQPPAAQANAPATGTEEKPVTIPEVKVKEIIDEVVVTGTGERKYKVNSGATALFGDEDRHAVPFSTTVIPQELIRDQQATNLTDALRTEPSVINWYGGGGAYPHEAFLSRGFRADFLNGNIMVDGIKTNDRVAVSLENLDRIEVLRGPLAYRTGFLAPGGVINLVTKRPTDTPYRSVTASVNQWGRAGLGIDVGGRAGRDSQFGYRINAAGEYVETQVKEIDGRRWFGALAFDWRVAPGHTLTVRADQTRYAYLDDVFYYLRLDTNNQIPNVNPRQYFGQKFADWRGGERHASLEWKSRITDKLSLTSQTGYFASYNDPSWITSPVPGSVQPNGNYTVSESRGLFSFKSFGHQTFVQWETQTGPVAHKITTGGSARWVDFFGASMVANIGTNNFFNPIQLQPSPRPLPSRTRFGAINSYGGFVSDYLSFAQRWHVLLGGRYERLFRENYRAGAKTADYAQTGLIPVVGVVFDLNSTANIYASYAEGLEIGGTAPNTAVNAGEVMDPLKSRQVEIGAKIDLWDGRASLDGALFTISKAAEFLDTTSNRYVQKGLQVHQGLEARLMAYPMEGLTQILGLQYLDASLKRTGNPATDNNRPHNVPAVHSTLYIDYALPSLKGLALNTLLEYVTERDIQEPNLPTKVPAYVRWDLGARYKHGLMTYRIGVENVADERYFVAAFFGLLEPGAPRTFKVSAQLEF